jgi:UPF0755 protein
MDPNLLLESPKKSRLKTILYILIIFLVLLAIISIYLMLPPKRSFDRKEIAIVSGSTLGQVSSLLYENDIIRSEIAFKILMTVSRNRENILKGNYLFERGESMPKIINRITSGDYGLTRYKITIPEGWNNRQIANTLKKQIPSFDSDLFISLASKYEGKLFPDTYLFFENVTPEEVISTLYENFNKKMSSIQDELNTVNRSLDDIIKMASIVEKEASSSIERKIVAGILWKRLDSDMGLQVDASFLYLFGKASKDITKEDLAIDSPYNSYKYRGLPPTPISNPGLATILDTIEYTKTNYWYYLTDSKGVFHYSPTFEGHIANKSKYLWQ